MAERTDVGFNYATIRKETGRANLHSRVIEVKVKVAFWYPEASDGGLTVTSIIRSRNQLTNQQTNKLTTNSNN